MTFLNGRYSFAFFNFQEAMRKTRETRKSAPKGAPITVQHLQVHILAAGDQYDQADLASSQPQEQLQL